MPSRHGVRMLAIGIDAAEPSLIHALVRRGDLPTLRRLFDLGASGVVTSPAHIANSAIWPSFITGTSLWAHEKLSLWAWNPRQMRACRERFDSLQPFWRGPELAERAVGVLDVPLAPPPAPGRRFEIAEWGTNAIALGGMRVWPPSLASRVRAIGGRHPVAPRLDAPAWAWVPPDLIAQCMDGIRRRARLIEHLLREERPELFIAVFGEAHTASHFLWHTADDTDHRGMPRVAPASGIVDLYRLLDRQLEGILEHAGEEAAVLVFSLNGMRPTRGVPLILDPLFRSADLAVPIPRSPLSRLRRRAPTPLKRLYHRFMPPPVRLDLSKFAVTPRYDWSHTRAFALPSEQYGWIRVNVAGREAAGIVEAADYGALCDRIERLLGDLRLDDGTPMVQRVIRTAPSDRSVPSGPLPDLVVHWSPATTEGPCELQRPAIRWDLGQTRLTGEHAPDGFWVFRSPRSGGPVNGASIAAEALGRVLVDEVTRA
jgi:predicted AlkP superfamily phosphohydrolase/phosphomutase